MDGPGSADKKYTISQVTSFCYPLTPLMNTVQMNKRHGQFTGCTLKEQAAWTSLI